jgi:subtilisin-like proprotein convertase family protein
VYYVLVHGFGGETGDFNLDLIDTGVAHATPVPAACAPPPPMGACCDCAAPPFNCVDTDEDTCALRGGNFLGADTVCLTPAPAIRYESAPGLPIGAAPNDVVSDTISVADSFLISDINVELQISHTWIGDMDITIEHNGTSVVLFYHQCGSTQNINSTADDEGTSLYCSSISLGPANAVFWPPDIAGLGPLSVYDGTDVAGDWTLTIVDTYPSLDDGVLNAWALVLPTGAPTANCPDQNNGFCFLCDGTGPVGDDDDDDDGAGGGGNVNASEMGTDYQNDATNFGR